MVALAGVVGVGRGYTVSLGMITLPLFTSLLCLCTLCSISSISTLFFFFFKPFARLLVAVVDRVYIVLFSGLQPTHCVPM